MAIPDDKKDRIARHMAVLQGNYYHYTGRYLFDPRLEFSQAAIWLEQVPFALVSHGVEPDPIFNYGNETALQLFGMTWNEFTRLPSRLSAEFADQAERRRLLDCVLREGYIEDYTGVRIAADGCRFLIRQATVWNLRDETGQFYGQAALIPRWEVLQGVSHEP
ncbi:MEKHLA domain-containing protein [Nitrosomonas sp.]|uniref:MEKHLA domain-containing protein n=1 Tax=Nitrosomonas sp. TaxID=42353 RepID=UPI0025D0CB34|nr:MEKHLA domain-containing protein [Nitrosomonas sp.]MCC6915986.1 MEKHLA domain-containing protein [Nitrosomonas sp.]